MYKSKNNNILNKKNVNKIVKNKNKKKFFYY